MIETQLILIEGFPGSGKTTTTRSLGETLRQRGVACRWFLEEDQPHPIDCTDFATHGLADQMIPLWTRFAEQALQEPVITLIESRLWQNTALFMYMSNCTVDEIVDLNIQQAQALAPLSPVLIYLDQPDTDAAMRRLVANRGEGWIPQVLETLAPYAWFQTRGQADMNGWFQFIREWQVVAGRLYDDWPHRKLKIHEPHADWQQAYNQIEAFLQI
jgi:thymidylate kinase